MSLDEFSAPECQISGCERAADDTREHPEFGEGRVCPGCARLWGDGQ